MLQGRIKELEQVLRVHDIDAEVATAAMRQQESSAPNDSVDSTRNQSRIDPDNDVQINQALSLEDDGEAHYFGPSSGRHEIRSLQGLNLLILNTTAMHHY